MGTIVSRRFASAAIALVIFSAASVSAGPLPPRRPRFGNSKGKPFDPQVPFVFDQLGNPTDQRRLNDLTIASVKDQASSMGLLVLHAGPMAKRLSAAIARPFKLPPGSPSIREGAVFLAPLSDVITGVRELSLSASGADHQELAVLQNFLLTAGDSGFEQIALAEAPLTFADGHSILGYAYERWLGVGDAPPDF